MLGQLTLFQRSLLNWYRRHRRDLPWRVPPGSQPECRPDPYHVLVSEAMLQQTQVAAVIPYFQRFIGLLPTIRDLANAKEQDVLRLWQGLGYYSRARHLLGTAKIIDREYGGIIPSNPENLMKLPGIGRYTAGAIASLAFDVRAPILDGNVARVLCRLNGIRKDPRQASVREHLWKRAEEMLPGSSAGDFNSALMELGATVCTPKGPACLVCPVREHCQAFAQGAQEKIPLRAPAKVRPVEKRWTICIQRGEEFLIEQRPIKGRWGGMWQFVTAVGREGMPEGEWVLEQFGAQVQEVRRLGRIEHTLTHRQYEFEVFHCRAGKGGGRRKDGRVWVKLSGLSDYPLPRPHIRIAQMIAGESQGV